MGWSSNRGSKFYMGIYRKNLKDNRMILICKHPQIKLIQIFESNVQRPLMMSEHGILVYNFKGKEILKKVF
jgi:hypothetical protein